MLLNLSAVSRSRAYRKFINRTRDGFSMRDTSGESQDGYKTIQGCRILVAQATSLEDKKNMLVAVELVVPEEKPGYEKVFKSLNVFLRRDTLYVVGYDNGKQKYEFSEEDKLIDDAIPIGYSGSYTHLETVGKTILDMSVGRKAMENFIYALCCSEPTIRSQKSALLTLVLHISESLRFHHISRFLIQNYTREGVKMLPVTPGLVHDWKDASVAILNSEDEIPNGKVIKNLKMAKKYVSIVLNVTNIN